MIRARSGYTTYWNRLVFFWDEIKADFGTQFSLNLSGLARSLRTNVCHALQQKRRDAIARRRQRFAQIRRRSRLHAVRARSRLASAHLPLSWLG